MRPPLITRDEREEMAIVAALALLFAIFGRGLPWILGVIANG